MTMPTMAAPRDDFISIFVWHVVQDWRGGDPQWFPALILTPFVLIGLLMIAGEFDLSVGSMIGFSGMMIAVFGVVLGWPMWLAILITFALALAIGALNGFIVIRTGLPSFIVTLAFLFILRGFTIYIPQKVESKTIIGGIRDAATAIRWLDAGSCIRGVFAS